MPAKDLAPTLSADATQPAHSTTHRYASGTVIAGRYELVSVIGRGGFGEVWLAHNRLLDNDVAVKLYAREDGDDTAVERLRTEARAAASLEHPAIVRVFDFGATDRGDPFLVMELLHGENLEDVLARGALSPRRAIKVLLPIVEGIATAHATGIIHRDIKLANIVLTREGARMQPKIVDFGLARAERRSHITLRGEVVGTPAYMSPEQARGDPVEPRSDVWSMSVALYELVTGRVPFHGENVMESLRAIRQDDPAPIELRGGIDPAFVELVMRGLHKYPGERWPSMRVLGIEMAKWLLDHGESEDICGTSLRSTWLSSRVASLDPTPPPFPAYRSSTRPVLILGLFLLLGIALSVAYAYRHHGLAATVPSDMARDVPPIAGRAPSSGTAPHPTPVPSSTPPRPVRILPPPVRDTNSVF